MIDGVITALATPYKNGKIDYESLGKLLSFQAESGVDAFAVTSTTGEHNFLTDGEKSAVTRFVRENCKNAKIIATVGSNDTKSAVKEAFLRKNDGANALLIAPPSFSKCTENGYVLHVKNISKTGLPLVLYNVPSRCGYEILPRMVNKCAKFGAVAVKDAGSDENYKKKVAVKTLCGSDERLLFEQFDGVISVTSNVAPLLTKSVLDGTATRVQRLAFGKLCDYCFCEINPVPVKFLLWLVGIFRDYSMRLPLTKASKSTQKSAEKLLENYGEWLK